MKAMVSGGSTDKPRVGSAQGSANGSGLCSLQTVERLPGLNRVQDARIVLGVETANSRKCRYAAHLHQL